MAKHSITLFGHKTSIFLEDEFWSALKEMADDKQIKTTNLVEVIDRERDQTNLSSAIRIAILRHLRSRG